jgi:hypothetical protein
LVHADCEGIVGPARGLPFWRQFVPWHEIETCEIVTRYGAFGDRTSLRPTFKNRMGKTLLRLDLALIMPRDQDRLVKNIKLRLPKSATEPPELQ